VPQWFWSPLYAESNGFFCARDVPLIDSGRAYCTSFRFLSKHASSSKSQGDSRGSDIQYKWNKLGFCTQWRPDEKSMTLLCFDLPDGLKDKMIQTLLKTPQASFSTNPFAHLAFVLPLIVGSFDRAVWSCRDLIRELEQGRPDVRSPKLQYVRMHEIARHAIHSTEMLATSLTVLDSIIAEVQQQNAQYSHSREELTAVDRDLNFHRSTMRCLQLRSQALEDRLRNEINLVSLTNEGEAEYHSCDALLIGEGLPYWIATSKHHLLAHIRGSAKRWHDHEDDQRSRHCVPSGDFDKRQCWTLHTP
jgi:hypothetical protein